jgi:hypothetical protein
VVSLPFYLLYFIIFVAAQEQDSLFIVFRKIAPGYNLNNMEGYLVLKTLKSLYKDEGGEVVQNIIWIFGGVLATVAAVSLLFVTIKGKLTDMNTGVTGIVTP